MKIGTVSLNYYGQNSERATQNVGEKVAALDLDFAGFTEIRSAAMVEGLARGLGHNYNLKGDYRESPLAHNRKRWRLIETHFKKATEGAAGITPNLYLVICVYQKRSNPKKVIEVISTHLVPLTLHGKKREQFGRRMEMWRNHWELLKEVVQDGLALGHTVFVVGDFNNRNASRNIIKQINGNAKWLIRKGLDWVFYVEGNVKVVKSPVIHNFSSGSDHQAHFRSVILH